MKKINKYIFRDLICVWFLLVLPCLMLGQSALVGTAKAAVTGTYDVALLRVQFSDVTGIYTVDQLNAAAPEIHDFYTQLSYNQLDLRVHVADVVLTGTWDNYINCTGESCRNILYEAVDTADSNGFDFTDIEGILIVRATCRLNDGRTFGPVTISQGTFQQSYVGECGTPDFPSGVSWRGWSHEIGHQLEAQDGRFAVYPGSLTHPTGYESGYNLMDSCYPCGEAALSLAPETFANDTGANAGNLIFPGWLPSSRIQVIGVTSGTGETVVLSPITESLTTSTAKMGIKIPISTGHYYFLEARRRLNADAWPGRAPDGIGIYDEGVQILKVDESAIDRLADTIDTCDTFFADGCIRAKHSPDCPPTATAATHPRCWPFPLWHTGNTFRDTTNNISISIGPEVGNGYTVTVTRGVPPGTPDLFVTPWLTPPMNTWETIDIWVDSSCNGYEDEGGSLRYGRHPDNTVIGSGDDPCANHPNRVYALVRNIGDAPATDASIRFDVTDPLGVGINGTWRTIDTVTPAQFPALASIPAGGEAIVYVEWAPSIDLGAVDPHDSRFSFHSCLRVAAAAVSGETNLTNLDGDGEQENIDSFEVIAASEDGETPSDSGLKERSFRLSNPAIPVGENMILNQPSTYYFMVDADLPEGWRYEVAGGKESVELKVGESREIPVKIIPGNSPDVGSAWHLKVSAYTMERVEPPPFVRNAIVEYLPHVLGGVDFSAQAVTLSKISIQVKAGDLLKVEGRIEPAIAGAKVMIDYISPTGKTINQLVTTDDEGLFRDVSVKGERDLKVQAFWQGSATSSSAASDMVTVAPSNQQGWLWWLVLIIILLLLLIVVIKLSRTN